jgi:1-acyl-sn-glycerol-3-phosphate acyltransferase
MLVLRSLVFNIVYYIATVVMILATAPIFLLAPRAFCMGVVADWARLSLFLLRHIAGTRLEVRGLANIPAGGAIIASKHQSMFETFALIPYLRDPVYVLKRELMLIPFFGWYAAKVKMIPVDRDRGSTALRALTERVRATLSRGAEVVIFPEGTRRPPGAEPAYRSGIAHLYRALSVPVVPVALNSGLFWPRRRLLRHPGTIVIEFLPAIQPGLKGRDFLAKLETGIEAASNRLLAEAAATPGHPPLGPEAVARLGTGRAGTAFSA